MGIIIRTLKYGSAKTKICIISIGVLLIGGGAVLAAGLISGGLLMTLIGGAAVFAGIVTLVMVSFGTEGVHDEIVSLVSENPEDKPSKTVRQQVESPSENPEDKPSKTVRQQVENTSDETEEFLPDIEEPHPKKREKEGRSTVYEDKEGAPDGRVEVREPEPAEYTVSAIKKFIRKYKVGRNNEPVIIDHSSRFKAYRTPALCWSKRDKVSFLLLEKDGQRVVTMPMSSFLNVTYERNVPETNMAEYEELKQNADLYEKFEDVMPSFIASGSSRGIASYTKNLYVLGGDVAVTPRSLKTLRQRYKFNVKIFDSFAAGGEYSIYFKKAYETRTLWTDNVIGQQDYQNRIRAILQTMVDDDDLLKYDFLDEVDNMIKYRLITTEYADYYKAMRNKKG